MTNQVRRFGLKECAEIATIFIAVLALFISVWSTYETRKHNRLSLKPHLSITSEFTSRESQNGVYLYNNGHGPALIKTFSVYIGENELNTSSPASFYNAIRKQLNFQKLAISVAVPKNGDVLKAGESHKILGPVELSSNLPEEQLLQLKEGLPRLRFVIKYESFYEEKFVIERTGIQGGILRL